MELTDILTILGVIVIGILVALYFLLVRHKADIQRRREEQERRREEESRRFEEERKGQADIQRRREEQERRREEESRRFEEERKLRDREEFAPEAVRFHALWHRFIRPEVWQTLLVYIFSGSRGLRDARSDFMRRKRAPADSYNDSSSMSRHQIRRGTEISIYPEMNGFRFNPSFANVLWLEDWHCIEFRMQALPETFEHRDTRFEGRIDFYVGPILIGETQLYAVVTDEAHKFDNYKSESSSDDTFWEETGTSPYRAIFVSYSHKDSFIVDRLELAYRALGDEYLRDIAVLRSGEKWNPALIEKIYRANVFQLCWSEFAKRSANVEEEWHHALSLRRQNFIRPMYWQIPMPTPPKELSDIHFAYIRIDSDDR